MEQPKKYEGLIDWNALRKLTPLVDELKTKGYNSLCAAVDGTISIRIEGVKICEYLGINETDLYCELVETVSSKGIISIYNHGYYTIISTAATHIDLLKKFIDRLENACNTKWKQLKKLAAAADALKDIGYNASYDITDAIAKLRIDGTKICDSRGLNKGFTDDILVQLDDRKGFISLKNCGDFTVISSDTDAIDLLEKYVNSIK